jgi:hypothetical protein
VLLISALGSRPTALRSCASFITFFQEKIFYVHIDSCDCAPLPKYCMGDNQIDQLIEQVRKLTLQVQELERAIDCTANPASTTTDIDFFGFATGNRVRILNSAKKPNAKEWHNNKARHATVTRIQGGRVYIVTDNGVSTWRSANNLRCTGKDE